MGNGNVGIKSTKAIIPEATRTELNPESVKGQRLTPEQKTELQNTMFNRELAQAEERNMSGRGIPLDPQGSPREAFIMSAPLSTLRDIFGTRIGHVEAIFERTLPETDIRTILATHFTGNLPNNTVDLRVKLARLQQDSSTTITPVERNFLLDSGACGSGDGATGKRGAGETHPSANDRSTPTTHVDRPEGHTVDMSGLSRDIAAVQDHLARNRDIQERASAVAKVITPENYAAIDRVLSDMRENGLMPDLSRDGQTWMNLRQKMEAGKPLEPNEQRLLTDVLDSRLRRTVNSTNQRLHEILVEEGETFGRILNEHTTYLEGGGDDAFRAWRPTDEERRTLTAFFDGARAHANQDGTRPIDAKTESRLRDALAKPELTARDVGDLRRALNAYRALDGLSPIVYTEPVHSPTLRPEAPAAAAPARMEEAPREAAPSPVDTPADAPVTRETLAGQKTALLETIKKTIDNMVTNSKNIKILKDKPLYLSIRGLIDEVGQYDANALSTFDKGQPQLKRGYDAVMEKVDSGAWITTADMRAIRDYVTALDKTVVAPVKKP